MDVLQSATLVLNKAYTPIHVLSVKQAIVKIMSNLAEAIDHTNYMTYGWEDWFSLPVTQDYHPIRTTQGDIRAPFVIRVLKYDQIPRFTVRLSRKNIFIRDRGTCQYSGRKLELKDATLDHVLPESRGGRTTWDNLVLCDRYVNHRKGNKTPEEAGLTLLSVPKKPQWTPIFKASGGKVPDAWKGFLPKDN